MPRGKRIKNNNSLPLLDAVISALQDKKGKNIVSLDLRKTHSSVTDFFVICHGTSKTQVDALAGEVLEKALVAAGTKPYNKEGFENSEWILIDFVDVVVHVFLEQTRQFYQLEKLWADAERSEHSYQE
ncbi:MAG: ribosome silencing factor [Bacteroidia bacterium]|jgi:ribosome-associated protein|nr:ribosome silencing factor [Bacteroidia bacterium]